MKKALLQMHAAVLLWGFTGVLGRAITLSAPVLVWYRMGLTALFMAVIISYRQLWQKLPKQDFIKVVGIGALFAVHWVAFYASIKYANASIALLCLSTASIFTAVLDPLINKTKVQFAEILLGLLAIVGVCCIYLIKPSGSTPLAPMKNAALGLLLGVCASVLSAIFTVFNKPLASKHEPRVLVFYEMLIGFGFLCLAAPFYLYQQPSEPIWPQGWDVLWLFCLVYFCTVLGQSLAMSALKHISTFTATFSVNLEPVYGILLAFLFFKENQQLSSGFYLGLAIITLSVLLQVWLLLRKRRTEVSSR